MRRIILDTDLAMGAPGSDIDDGFALALALAEPELSVDLVTTVNGNTDVDTATLLTLELLHRLGRADVPVVRGAARPLRRPLHETAARSRAADARRSVPAREPQPGNAATAIVDRVLRGDAGQYTLVCIGPLTNAALALATEPRLADLLDEIVVMGGVFTRQTNRRDMPGEFNIWVDPDAAAIVLASGASLRFVGLDVTLQVRLTREHAQRLKAGGQAFGAFAGEATLAWIEHLERTGRGVDEAAGSAAMHDPLAVAVLTQPDLVTWRSASLAVETVGEVARGVTVADFLAVEPMEGGPLPTSNCAVATEVRVDAFTEYFLDRIGSLTDPTPGERD